MLISQKKIDELIPASYNPRKISKIDYERLKRSIKELGYVEPVIWNKTSGHVVGGHQRLKVLKELGYDEVDCVVVELDDDKERALNIALNKISGMWDQGKLFEVLGKLDDVKFDIELTGFRPLDISEHKFNLDMHYGGDGGNLSLHVK